MPSVMTEPFLWRQEYNPTWLVSTWALWTDLHTVQLPVTLSLNYNINRLGPNITDPVTWGMKTLSKIKILLSSFLICLSVSKNMIVCTQTEICNKNFPFYICQNKVIRPQLDIISLPQKKRKEKKGGKDWHGVQDTWSSFLRFVYHQIYPQKIILQLAVVIQCLIKSYFVQNLNR